MSRLIKRASPLIFPGTNPGFDPAHPASAGIAQLSGFSAVFLANGTHIDLHTGVAFAPTDVAPAIYPIIGPCGIQTPTGNANEVLSGYGAPGGFASSITIACIFQADTFPGGFGTLVQGRISDTNPSLGILGGHPIIQTNNGTQAPFIFAVDTPYFVAGSIIGSVVANLVWVNLTNGQTGRFSYVPNGIPASDGSYVLFAASWNSHPIAMSVAMVSYTFLNMPQLLQWAADPWAFWYPQKLDLSMMLAAPTGGTPPPSPSVGISGLAAAEW